MAVYSVFVVAYWQSLLQNRLSHSIEQYNEPSRLQGTSQNRILWFKSTRRMPGAEILGTPLKKLWTGEKRCLTVKISYPS